MIKTVFLLSIIIYQPIFAGANRTCIFSGQLGLGVDNTEQWIELSKALSIEGAEKDLKGFCEWNRMDRSVSGITGNVGVKEKYRISKSAGNRQQAADVLIEADSGRSDNWQRTLMGHPDLKNLAGSSFENICGFQKAVDCAGNISEKIKGIQNGKRGAKFTYTTPEYISRPAVKIGTPKISAACLYVSPANVFGCSAAAKDAMNLLATAENGGAEVTGASFIRETISDPKITGALQRVSADLLGKVDRKEFADGDNIFFDLTNELLKDGFDSKMAKKMATKILGAIATGGPNFYLRVNKKDIQEFPEVCSTGRGCNPNSAFMAAIAEGLAMADTVMMQKKLSSIYSLPKGAGFPCDTGKTYHFWLSAALADSLVDKGHSPEAARSAVMLAQIGYQLVPRGEPVPREKKLLSLPRFGAVENGIRMDLNLAAAGASFGKSLADRTGDEPIKLKEGFVTTLKNSTTSPSTSTGSMLGESAEVYEWLNRNAVDTVNSFYP